jgi:hypothetical protein
LKKRSSNDSKAAKYLSKIKAKIEDNSLLIESQNERIISLVGEVLNLDNENIEKKLQEIVADEYNSIKAIYETEDPNLYGILEKIGSPDDAIKQSIKRNSKNSPYISQPHKKGPIGRTSTHSPKRAIRIFYLKHGFRER